jgi:hypothetical protein
MRRIHKALASLALGLALVGATTTAATAATPPTGTRDQADQQRALYQSELERNSHLRDQGGDGLAAQRKALYQSELERNLATAPAADVAAAQPTGPATSGSHVDVVAALLIGLVVGAAAVVGWTATTHRRRPRAAAGI